MSSNVPKTGDEDDPAGYGRPPTRWPAATPPASGLVSAHAAGSFDEVSVWELLEAAPDALVVVDNDGLIAYANRQATGLTGYERSWLLGKPVSLLVPDGARARHAGWQRAYLEAPRLRMMGEGLELELRRADGALVPVEISLAPVRTGASSGMMVATSIRDVTHQRDSDRARRQVLALLDQEPDAVYVLDADSTVIEYANLSAHALLGYHEGGLIGQRLSDLTLERSAPGSWDLTDEGIDLRLLRDVTRRTRSGGVVPCDTRFQAVRGADGTDKLVVVDRDSRERMAGEHLKTQRKRMTDLITGITRMVLADDPPTAVLQRVVEGTAELLGCSSAAILLADLRSDDLVLVASVGAIGRLSPSDLNLPPWLLVSGPAGVGAVALPEPPPGGSERSRGLLGPGAAARLFGLEDRRGVLAAFLSPGGNPLAPPEVDLLGELTRQLATVMALGDARSDRQRLAVLEDRERIARDLHDTVIQELIGIGMELNAARSFDEGRDDRLVDQLDATIRQLRAVVFDAAGPATGRTVGESIRATVTEATRAIGHRPSVDLTGPIDALPPEVSAHLLPALRETLSNVARHADASQTAVEVTVEAGTVTLTVDDDGRGPGPGDPSGSGISNLRRRAALLGGSLEITARPSGGCRVRWSATVPTVSS